MSFHYTAVLVLRKVLMEYKPETKSAAGTEAAFVFIYSGNSLLLSNIRYLKPF